MVRLESEYTAFQQFVKENSPPPESQKNPPHGVDPKTYSFLLAAIDYNKKVKNIFGNIDPKTINLIKIYFTSSFSITEVATFEGLTRNTAKNRILKGLKRIWEQLPSNIQKTFLEEEIIKMKDPTTSLKHTNREITKALWENPEYRRKTMEGIQRKSQDPNFIQTMKTISQGRRSPMEGKKHTSETIEKIRKATQEIWNRKHNMEKGADPLTKRVALFGAWLEMTQLLGRSPYSKEIEKLRKENKTPFSITMYKQEFGKGSFARAKKELDRLTTLAGLSFEAAQKLTDYLTSKSKELAEYGISEEDIQKHIDQIKEVCRKILSATSEEEQAAEHLDLLLSRIWRKISTMTPLYIDQDQEIQSSIPLQRRS